jgi:hypothetical protein
MLTRLHDRHASLGKRLVEQFRLRLLGLAFTGALLEDCKAKTGKADVDEALADATVIGKVGSRLRETHRLGAVR